MRCSKLFDDSSDVNVHGAIPVLRVKLAMVFLNLLVWANAAMRIAG